MTNLLSSLKIIVKISRLFLKISIKVELKAQNQVIQTNFKILIKLRIMILALIKTEKVFLLKDSIHQQANFQ